MCHGEIPESGLNKLKEIKTRQGKQLSLPDLKAKEGSFGRTWQAADFQRS